MIIPRYLWRTTTQTQDTRSSRNHESKRRRWSLSSLFGLKSQPKQEILPRVTCAPTPTTSTAPTCESGLPNSPLLNLPAELRQKILRYTITDEEILRHLLYESVQTSPETWEARVYYFDGREFAWDDEVKMFSRAPFDESRALELVHPLLKKDMEYVKGQWIKRVRAIGEEKRVEVMKEMKNGEYRGFAESTRFPKSDMNKSVLALMKGERA